MCVPEKKKIKLVFAELNLKSTHDFSTGSAQGRCVSIHFHIDDVFYVAI